MKGNGTGGNLFGKTLLVAAMGLILTGCAGAVGADSLPQLVQQHEEALNADDFIKAQNALCAPSTTQRLKGASRPRENPVIMATAKPGPTPARTPYPTSWAAPWREPGPRLPIEQRIWGTPTPRPPGGHGIVTQEMIDNDPKARAAVESLRSRAEERRQASSATKKAEEAAAAAAAAAARAARATRQAEEQREEAREEGPRPTFEIRDFESATTDLGARAEILLDIYADGGPAGREYSILYALYEENKWWVDCDRG